jgi:hypothetical protein
VSARALRPGPRCASATPRGQRVERLVALLEDREGEAVSVCALREQGIDAPAQAIYELQLTGYIVDRVAVRYADGRASFGYRLGGASDRVWAEHRLIGGDGR